MEATAFCNQDYNLRESEDGVKGRMSEPKEGHFPGNSYPRGTKKGFEGQRAVQNTWLCICSLTE